MADTAIVVLLGQSLNAWRGTTRELETGDASARILVGGGTVQEMDFYGSNADHAYDWNETLSVVTQSESASGQSPIAGIATTLADAGYTRIYLCSVAVSGKDITTLRSRGQIINLYGALDRLVSLAAAQGDTDPAIYFYSAHGEADGSAAKGAAYESSALAFYQRCQLAAAQAVEDSSYVSPIILSYPVQNKFPTAGSDASDDIAVKEAIKNIADSSEIDNIILYGSIYHYALEAGADFTHPSEAEYVLRGEGIGKVIADHIGGTTYTPLRIISVTRSGDEITVQFTDDIIRDITTLGDVGSSLNGEDGFEYIDNGSGINISSIDYSGDTATITLASTPAGSDAQQILKLGMQVTPVNGTDVIQLAGTVIRKDAAAWASTFDVTYDNYDWALQEEITGFPYSYTPPVYGGGLIRHNDSSLRHKDTTVRHNNLTHRNNTVSYRHNR